MKLDQWVWIIGITTLVGCGNLRYADRIGQTIQLPPAFTHCSERVPCVIEQEEFTTRYSTQKLAPKRYQVTSELKYTTQNSSQARATELVAYAIKNNKIVDAQPFRVASGNQANFQREVEFTEEPDQIALAVGFYYRGEY